MVALAGALVSPASAQTLPSPHTKIILAESAMAFDAAGTLTTVSTMQSQALTGQGAQNLTKYSYGFNVALETMELVEAYTLKKSGGKVQVAKDAITTQKGAIAQGVGATMPDWQVQQLTFPSVEQGDSVVWKTKKIRLKPSLPGWQSEQGFVIPMQDIDMARWTITAPENLPLHIASSMPPAVSTTSGGQMMRKYEWSGKGRVLDAMQANTRVTYPHVMVSTVSRHEDIAKLFAKEVMRKAAPNDELDLIVKTLILSKDTDEAKAQAIYDWVRKRIKYVALYMANDGWEPHDIAHILQKRYGDCKDHVTLMYAMLKIAGVPAQTVLVSTFNEFELDAIPSYGSYNHTILYLPSIKRYLDPTASSTPFSAIPGLLSGKPVVVADDKEAFIGRMPRIVAENNVLLVSTVMAVAANGSAKGTLSIDAAGFAAASLQNRLAQIPAGFSGSAVDEILRTSNFKGSGTLTYPKVNTDIEKQSLKAELEIADLLREPTAGSAAVHPSLNMPVYILSNMGNHAQESREFGYSCNSMRMREEMDITYDAAYKLSRLPANFEAKIQGVSFTATYQTTGNRITGSRELLISHDSQYCSPQEYERRKGIMRQIQRHLRAPVLYAQD
jgi:predicted transglutaminase-like cysteine proteinase